MTLTKLLPIYLFIMVEAAKMFLLMENLSGSRVKVTILIAHVDNAV